MNKDRHATPMLKLKLRREAQGLTQDALAKKVGCHRQTIYCYEAGVRVPKLRDLHRLARALKCTTADLIEDDSEETTANGTT